MTEKEILEDLKEILNVTNSVKLERIRRALGLEQDDFDRKIFKWAKKFGFKINREYINVTGGNVNRFINHLESQFESWDIHENGDIGKVESVSDLSSSSDKELKSTAEVRKTAESKGEKKCNFNIKLGKQAMREEKYGEAISRYQRAKKICEDKLFDEELLVKINKSIRELKKKKMNTWWKLVRTNLINRNGMQQLAPFPKQNPYVRFKAGPKPPNMPKR